MAKKNEFASLPGFLSRGGPHAEFAESAEQLKEIVLLCVLCELCERLCAATVPRVRKFAETGKTWRFSLKRDAWPRLAIGCQTRWQPMAFLEKVGKFLLERSDC